MIDDIWSTEAWNSIQHMFPQNDLGSRIITTTRIENVASACCNHRHDRIYKIEHLNNQDSRRLFFRRVFGTEDTCPEHFEKISEEIFRNVEVFLWKMQETPDLIPKGAKLGYRKRAKTDSYIRRLD